MIADITPAHHAQILRINTEFVHWLAPMDQAELTYVLARAAYARQIDDGAGGFGGVLIGYAHDTDYPDHWNIDWLKMRIEDFFYIDRIIIDGAAQGQGLGQRLYADITQFARARGHKWLACEVNIIPDNPASHNFHQKLGFKPIGEQSFSEIKAVRYYAKALNSS